MSEAVDYAVVGTYVANPATTQCAGDCNTFYKIENYKVIISKVGNFPVEFNKTDYKSLVFRDS